MMDNGGCDGGGSDDDECKADDTRCKCALTHMHSYTGKTYHTKHTSRNT